MVISPKPRPPNSSKQLSIEKQLNAIRVGLANFGGEQHDQADGRGGGSRERSMPMPRQVADALAEWQVKAPEGVPFVLLSEARYAALRRGWALCRSRLPRGGAKKARDWQNRDVINNVLRSVKGHARKAGIKLTSPITVHTFRKSYGQTHAENGTRMHVLQQLMGHSNITTTRSGGSSDCFRLRQALLRNGSLVRLTPD